jgi:hypothetical protein
MDQNSLKRSLDFTRGNRCAVCEDRTSRHGEWLADDIAEIVVLSHDLVTIELKGDDREWFDYQLYQIISSDDIVENSRAYPLMHAVFFRNYSAALVWVDWLVRHGVTHTYHFVPSRLLPYRRETWQPNDSSLIRRVSPLS